MESKVRAFEQRKAMGQSFTYHQPNRSLVYTAILRRTSNTYQASTRTGSSCLVSLCKMGADCQSKLHLLQCSIQFHTSCIYFWGYKWAFSPATPFQTAKVPTQVDLSLTIQGLQTLLTHGTVYVEEIGATIIRMIVAEKCWEYDHALYFYAGYFCLVSLPLLIVYWFESGNARLN